MKLIEIIKSDYNSEWSEIKSKSYNLHWIGGLIVTSIFTFLFINYSDFPSVQPYIISIILNALFWSAKEFIWFTAFTFEKHFTFLTKMRKFKIFAWSKPDWKDVRFSVYGSIPLSLIMLMFKDEK